MDCPTAQEEILEALASARPYATTSELESHLAGCDACRTFRDTQLALDLQLSAAISVSALSPVFRQSLLYKIDQEPVSAWPEFLPDIAHIAGCIGAILVCLSVLPYSASWVVLAGLIFTLATYFLEIVLRGSLEAWED